MVMYIGHAAVLSGVPAKTIRHYEELGLLPNIDRIDSYRIFTESDIEAIKLIKHAKQAGINLSEMKRAYVSENCLSLFLVIDELIKQKEANLAGQILKIREKQTRLQEHSIIIRKCFGID